ncbi:helix-turn-helix transcriptional regulator [Pseudonocardia aurantiaca]|uniref:AAA family ATPase n=1 Tax=Pseudonocardia aurantiaca TaxID=75290 RepID=A0ABW4FDV6_9PSEU
MGRPGIHARPRLLGRRSECAALDRLLDDARAGRSSVLVLRGESGCGKSALLDFAHGRAARCRVVRIGGAESEMELAYAGLHQLCVPILGRLDHLPAPQGNALRVAFGLSEGAIPDRFLVGLAVLTLLSEVATEQPLVCVVDDAQWLDRASVQALAFAARRLLAEPVGMVFAVREPSYEQELTGLPAMLIEGIGDTDARHLLASAIRGRLDEQVRDRIVAETRGNPLALLELTRGLSPAELAGGFALPDARPLASRIEQSFARQLQQLPRDTQQFLLLAAAEPVGDATLLRRAAERLGVGADAAAPAESAGLIELGSRVRFRHPLVRSAAYRHAPWPERRRVHLAIAEATDPQDDPDRRAWHRANAAQGPDADVAAELERSAGRAQSRGGVAAAAAFLERATELTPDPARRTARALAAARAKFEAAAPDAALALLMTAEMGRLDDLQQAGLERLRAQVAFTRTRGSDAPMLLLKAAKRLEPLDARLARETYLEAFEAASFAGRLTVGGGMLELAEAARSAPPAPDLPPAIDQLLVGLITRSTEGYAAAVGPLRRALETFSQKDGVTADDSRWLWFACRIASDLWDDDMWHELAARQVRLTRAAGMLSLLPLGSTYRAAVHVHAGEFGDAAALVDEADAIAQATGNAPLMYAALVLASWRGQQEHVMELIERGIRDATARGEGRAIALAEYATAVVYNGLGNYSGALAAAQRAGTHDDLGLLAWLQIELIEAAARCGQPEAAADALRCLSERTRAAGTDWGLGIEARSRALLGDGPAAEALYREAIDRLGRSRIVIHLARAHLLYGEWLRRENRRIDAREQLRRAHEIFTRIGAQAFAERARRDLLATGETVRTRTVDRFDELTAQEGQIARLARSGLSNPEIGAQLFVSPRTVEWHLRKIFAKLGISSRRQLIDVLPELGRVASSM